MATDSGLLVLQGFAALVLYIAAALGDTSLRPPGLWAKGLNDHIGLTILAVCVCSYLIATELCRRATRSWNPLAGWGFVWSIAIGWLAASVFVFAPGTISECISWTAAIWLLALVAWFGWSASRVLRAVENQ